MQVVGIDLSRLAPGLARESERLLSPSETRLLDSQPSRHRAEWGAGRLALKLAAAPHCRKPWYRVNTGYLPTGQPCILDAPALHCSLSHSADLAVAAVGRSPVGIDVERVRPRSDALLPYIARRAEIDLLSPGPIDGGLITRIWTIKEAALKSGGWGLAIPPRAAEIRARVGRLRFHVWLAWRAIERDLTVWSTSVRGSSLSIASNEPNPLGGIRWDPAFDLPTR